MVQREVHKVAAVAADGVEAMVHKVAAVLVRKSRITGKGRRIVVIRMGERRRTVMRSSQLRMLNILHLNQISLFEIPRMLVQHSILQHQRIIVQLVS